MKVFYWCITLFLTLNFFNTTAKAQNNDIGDILPKVDYDRPQKYTIADIKITGLQNKTYDDFTLIGFSGLSMGDIIEVPGIEITNAVKRFWRQGLFEDIKILVSKIEDNNIWLEINLKERPIISNITFTGVKKNERKDLEGRIGMVINTQITPNKIDRANTLLKKYFDERGFNKAEIIINQTPDISKENHVILAIDIVKKNKIKVNRITINGNDQVKVSTLEKAMKKTRHKSNFKAWLRNFLRSTKYVPENYEEDKDNLIEKYNELGYRDAIIIWDTVYTDALKADKVDIEIKVDEGKRYYLKDIKWVGNTIEPTWRLQSALNMRPGDVYNQKKLTDRLSMDEDAVMNIFYQNNGYIFSKADPVEVNISNDSIDLEIRITEGPQASIRKVTITGNDRVYEDVIRRELRVKPGTLYSRDDIIRSIREIAQTGHFDPENMQPKIDPDPESGTVDIGLPLVSKANDQVEFSAGWGQTGVIGKLSLKFTNFSLKNLLHPSTYRGIIPQGEGQTLTLSGQTNGRYYQSYGISFLDPWFRGKRPNSLSFSAHYSKMTGVENRFYNRSLYTQYYPENYRDSYDTNKYMQNYSFSLGYGKRLNWPDDYFHFMATINYQIYKMKNWDYYLNFINNGLSHNINLELSLQRNSIDNPIYPRRGSQFLLSVNLTPPYSLLDGKDYASMDKYSPEKYKLIEYHKWKFRTKVFMPLASAGIKRMPVLMSRVEYGLLGSYNKHKKSPFENYYVGGDMSSGGSYSYGVENIPMRGYASGSLGTNAFAYTKIGMEVRYPLILEPSSTIYALGFLEGGNAWDDIKEINPFDLKRSAGFGVRIMLPMIGLLGFDWTYGFDAINGSRSNSGTQFQFVLGQEF